MNILRTIRFKITFSFSEFGDNVSVNESAEIQRERQVLFNIDTMDMDTDEQTHKDETDTEWGCSELRKRQIFSNKSLCRKSFTKFRKVEKEDTNEVDVEIINEITEKCHTINLKK